MNDRLPNFLIVGAARCGTSWLAKNLSMHPEIFMPRRKELHFFDRHYDKGIDWYKLYFPGRSEHLVGEATPGYLSSRVAPERIRKHLPDARIIIVLRDPVERAYSHYWNLVAKARRKRKQYDASFEDKVRSSAGFINDGLYCEKIERYYSLFPRQNIKVGFYDDLSGDPGGFLREVLGFLSVDADFDSGLTHFKANAASSKLGKSRTLYWLYIALVRLGLNRVGEWIDEQNRPSLPRVKDETKAMLLDRYYLSEIERLENMFARDLSSWKS